MKSRHLVLIGALGLCAACSPSAASKETFGSGKTIEESRIEEQLTKARTAYHSLLTAQDGGVPESLLAQAKCVAVLPGVIKAAFIGGGRYGKGVVSCRDDSGGWTPPAFVELTGGSIGWQIGAESADLVLFFTGADARDSVTKDTGLTLGADIGVAAGPIGRRADAKTDFSRSGMFSYAQSRGLFAGISLEGAVLSPDWDTNHSFYGKTLSTHDIIVGSKPFTVPPAADGFLSVLPHGGSGNVG